MKICLQPTPFETAIQEIFRMEPYIFGGHRYYRKISQKRSKRTTELARPPGRKDGTNFQTHTIWVPLQRSLTDLHRQT